MKYTLNFNANGQMVGWQEIGYELGGMEILECHLVSLYFGETDLGFIRVVDRKNDIYFFSAENWGTIEIARDAAEEFACYGGNAVQVLAKSGLSWDMFPNTEEVLV